MTAVEFVALIAVTINDVRHVFKYGHPPADVITLVEAAYMVDRLPNTVDVDIDTALDIIYCLMGTRRPTPFDTALHYATAAAHFKNENFTFRISRVSV